MRVRVGVLQLSHSAPLMGCPSVHEGAFQEGVRSVRFLVTDFRHPPTSGAFQLRPTYPSPTPVLPTSCQPSERRFWYTLGSLLVYPPNASEGPLWASVVHPWCIRGGPTVGCMGTVRKVYQVTALDGAHATASPSRHLQPRRRGFRR